MSANILAIDDEPTCLEIIKFSLESKGYKVHTAESGTDGIEFLKKDLIKIDLILLDLMMPGICGLTTLKQIKLICSAKEIPIIMQTGAADYNEMKNTTKFVGINYVIVKPYSREELTEKVGLALAGQFDKEILQPA